VFTKANQCTIATQVLNLAETKQYATVPSVSIAAARAWTLHTSSDINSVMKKTIEAYTKSVELFCHFGAKLDSQYPGGTVVPGNRHVVVLFSPS